MNQEWQRIRRSHELLDEETLEKLFPTKQPKLHVAEQLIYNDFGDLIGRCKDGGLTYGMLNDWMEFTGAPRWQAKLMLQLEDALVAAKDEFKKEQEQWTSSHSS